MPGLGGMLPGLGLIGGGLLVLGVSVGDSDPGGGGGNPGLCAAPVAGLVAGFGGTGGVGLGLVRAGFVVIG